VIQLAINRPAVPYFRVFNPFLQGEKFDSDGVYVGRWVPELAQLPTSWIHLPVKRRTTGAQSRGRGSPQELSGADHRSQQRA
jgi:deoxyribodipyrimidine photolyase